MTDQPQQAESSNSTTHISGGVNLDAQRDINIVGDVIGRDKIVAYQGYTVEQVQTLLTTVTSTFQPKPFDGRCPYLGLDAFTEDDAERFFGREKLVVELVECLAESRGMVLAGPSGSGKSSVVGAGLVHQLKHGALPHSEHWLYARLTPGREPIEALARMLARLAKSPEAGEFVRRHAADAHALHQSIDALLSERPDQRAVIVVDQFEEIFTQVNTESERAAFLDLLTTAATVAGGRVIVIFVLRSDFVANCAAYPRLNALLNQQFRQVAALQPDELVSAIARPALQVGLRIDPDLIAQIMNDMQDQPGALPLMQFALKDLFEAQASPATGGVSALTLNDYLARGGVRTALERHADAVFAEFTAVEQHLARTVFSRLIEVGRGVQDTRRIARFDDLVTAEADIPLLKALLQKLADARLITTDQQANQVTATLAHEALIEAWPWLRRLVNENRDAIALQNQIAADAQAWERNRRDASYLYSGAKLAQAREQLAEKKISLSHLARTYVQASQARHQRRQGALIIGVVGIMGVLIAASIMFSTQSAQNAHLAKQNAQVAATAQAASTLAVSEAKDRATAQAQAHEQAQIALSRQLASTAELLRKQGAKKLTLATLLAIESEHLNRSFEGDLALRTTLNMFPSLRARLKVIPVSVTNSDNDINAVIFSPDGQYVAAGGQGQVITIWAASDWSVRRRIAIYESGVVPIIRTMAWSADSQLIAAGLDNEQVRVWNVRTGAEVARIQHTDQVFAVDFSSDGKIAASGDGSVLKIWEVNSGKVLHELKVPCGTIQFSPDGSLLAAAYTNKLVIIDVESAQIITQKTADFSYAQTIRPEDMNIETLAFSPDSRWLASGEGLSRFVMIVPRPKIPAYVRVWEARTGNEVAKIAHDDEVISLGFSPDGKLLASGGQDGWLRVWSPNTGGVVSSFNASAPVQKVAFDASSERVYIITSFGVARSVDAISGEELARFVSDSESTLTDFALSPDGNLLAAGNADGAVWVWVITSDQRQALPQGKNVAVAALHFLPDGKSLFTATWSGEADIWDIDNRVVRQQVKHDKRILASAMSAQGRYVASASYDGNLKVMDVSSGNIILSVDLGALPSTIAFSPDQRFLAVSRGSVPRDGWLLFKQGLTREPSRVTIFDLASKQTLIDLPHPDWVSTIAFSPDSRLLFSGGEDGAARVWKVDTGQELQRVQHAGRVNIIAISPDGKLAASAEACFPRLSSFALEPCSPTLRVWNTQDGAVLWKTALAGRWTPTLRFTPDNQLLIAVNNHIDCQLSECGLVQSWAAQTGQLVTQMVHEGIVVAFALSADGQLIASGDVFGVIKLWSPQTGQMRSQINFPGEAWTADFSPDGLWLAVGGLPGVALRESYARIYPVHGDALIEMACQRVNRNLTTKEWSDYLGHQPYRATCPNIPDVAPEANGQSSSPSISADGQRIVFESAASNLVCGDTNAARDIFLYDQTSKQVQLVSRGIEGEAANRDSYRPSFSVDGSAVYFYSSASNLITGSDSSQYYVFDLTTHQITLSGESTIPQTGSVSADGRYAVSVQEYASADTNGEYTLEEIVLRDAVTGHMQVISSSPADALGNRDSSSPFMTPDGRFVVFASEASNLVSDDTNDMSDVFVYGRQSGTLQLISKTSTGEPLNGHSFSPSISADGRWVVFASMASNLQPDHNDSTDLYLLDRQTGQTIRITNGIACP